MKYTWEPKDITAGRVYTKPCTVVPNGWHAKHTYQIGYDASREDSDQYTPIAWCDGMICKPRSRQEFAVFLNEEGYVPITIEHLCAVLSTIPLTLEG